MNFPFRFGILTPIPRPEPVAAPPRCRRWAGHRDSRMRRLGPGKGSQPDGPGAEAAVMQIVDAQIHTLGTRLPGNLSHWQIRSFMPVGRSI
jgi:hypothetical protein